MASRRFKVLWTFTAKRDLAAIVDYISDESMENAAFVLGRIRKKVSTLYTMPNRGRLVPELLEHGIQGYRELILSPWRVVFRISGNTVLVTAVIDSRRNVEDLLLERFIRDE